MKKIIDSKGKLFGKLNIIDLLIIIVVLILALSATKKLDETAAKKNTDKTIVYTVKIQQVRQATVDALYKETEGIIDFETKKAIGDIVDIEVSKAIEPLELVDGSYTTAQYENKFDMNVTMKVKGTETEDNYYTMDGKTIIVGGGLNLYNGYANISGVVSGVEVIKE